MGGDKNYIADGGFLSYEYKSKEITENGIKILDRVGHKHSGTPLFSNTPDTMYAKINSRDGCVDQIAVYGNGADKRKKLKDIDMGHPHTNPDKKLKFSETDIHIHDYDKKGTRSKYARKPSKKERRLIMMSRYGKRSPI